MIELIVRLLPLIFFSSAIGIFLLNIRPIFTYFIYVVSMAVQPKQLLQTSQEIEHKEADSVVYKFSLLTPFTRVWTLFRVLFLPDLDVSSVIHRSANSNTNWMSSVYSQKTQEEMSSVKIKTYSIAGTKDTSHFRSSYEPSITPPVSEEFAKAFPDLTRTVTSVEQFENNLSPQIDTYQQNKEGTKQI